MPGLLLYGFDAPLFSATAPVFPEAGQRETAARPAPVKCLIIPAEPITDIDTTAADVLNELVDDLDSRGIELRFAELKGTVHDLSLIHI